MSRSANAESAAAERVEPETRVLREHVEILREIKAPDKLIQLAERVAAANTARNDDK